METSVVDNPESNRFEIHAGGKLAGFLSYERTESTISFTDIVTDPDLAGRGIGLPLVRGALDGAAADGLSVLPVHPFTRDYIQRHPVYLDLVPAEERKRFELPVDEAGPAPEAAPEPDK